MVKFKLKLNQIELKALGSSCLYESKSLGNVNCLEEIVLVDTLERLYLRTWNMFAIDREKYNLRLNAIEAHIVGHILAPKMKCSQELLISNLGCYIEIELDKQLDRELCLFNAKRHE